MKVGFTVDSLNLIAHLHAQADDPGTLFGLALMHTILQKVAKRSIELNDKKMLDYMMRLHLVEKKETGDEGK